MNTDQLELGTALERDLDAAFAEAEAGMEKARSAQRVQVWRDKAEDWIARRSSGTVLTADDLVAAIGLPDEGVARNNAVGGVFGSWSKRGIVSWAGTFRKSERKIGHGNLQREWVKT